MMSQSALFGRYWPGKSLVHALDPRMKVLGTLAMVVMVFCAQNAAALGFASAFVLAVIIASRIPPLEVLRSIAPLSFIIVVTALFNLAFVQGGEVYVDWGWLQISRQGIAQAVFISIRLLLLLLTGSLLTLTTTSMDITEAIERLLAPLAAIGLPAHEFAFVLGTALRFLPQFDEEFHQIRVAQIARGARLSTSPFRTGLSSITSLMVPLFASVFRHADTLSDAMEARCYHGASGRTRLHPLRFGWRDILAAAALICALGVVIGIDWLL